MSRLENQELCKTLLRLKLATQAQIEDALLQLGSNAPAPAELLDLLEQRSVLTAYQTARLKKGETDGLVLGRYKLMYRNASGSFARVYRACDVQNGKMLGLKLLRQRWSKDPEAVKDFRREAELGQSLKHENIVPIFEIGQDKDQHYFTMEFVEGGNLRDFINIRKKLSPAEATKCILEMTNGLHYAVSRGAMHRDLKMTNVLMSSQGVALLVDFGLSGAPASSKKGRGEEENVQRALDYATLEKNTGAPRDDPRSDLYFLGGIYYELLTGVPPVERTRDRNERSQFSRLELVRPVQEVDPELPRSVTAVVDKLMRLEPSQRYQNTGEVIRDLRPVLAELTGTAGPGTVAPGSSASEAVRAAAEALKPPAPVLPVLLCVESRPRQQNMLREYFSKHGFRVMLVGDPQRALARLENSPPDCLVLMAEAAGESAVDAFRQARKLTQDTSTSVVLVLGEKQANLKAELQDAPKTRILLQPVVLRLLRKTIQSTLDGDQSGASDSDKNVGSET